MGAHAETRTAALVGPALPERYRPLRLIAAGGTARVWCAEDRSLSRRVAVKLLAEPYTSDPAAVRRFSREARAAAHLSAHPHVVTIYDIGQTLPRAHEPAAPFIVMEYLPGGTVADALRVGEVSLDDAVRWLHEAASALDYAHAKGIVHRDIKPANLLLDRDRGLHVADFGIAQIGPSDSLTIAGQVLGTASYLAPERAIGRPATVSSDLYSLAVTAFELLVGRRPFIAESHVATARQHLEDEPPRASELNPRLPRTVDAILSRGMAKAPEHRWSSAEAFASAISRALAPAAATTRSAAVSRGRRAAIAASAARPLDGGATRVRPARRAPVAVTPRRPGVPVAEAFAHEPRTRRVTPLSLLGAALSLAAMLAGVVWILSSGRHPSTTMRAAATTTPPAAARQVSPPRAHRVASHPAPRHAVKHASAPKPPAPTPPPVPTADTLEAQGHSLVYGGQPTAAVPVLRRALDAAAPGSLTYAYAEFDLAHALRLSGDPAEAVRLLVARLKIPNQTGKVRAELVLALQELARQNGSLPSGGASPAPPGKGHGHGHDHAPLTPNAQAGPTSSD